MICVLIQIYNSALQCIFILRLTRFDVSDYDSPDDNVELETRGLLSSTVLAEPLEVGTAVISANVLFHGSPVSKDN